MLLQTSSYICIYCSVYKHQNIRNNCCLLLNIKNVTDQLDNLITQPYYNKKTRSRQALCDVLTAFSISVECVNR